MAKRFRGEGTSKLDDKGRLLLPAQLRSVLQGVDGRIPTDPRPVLVMVYGDDAQRHLEFYTEAAMDDLADKIDSLPEGPVKWAAQDKYFGQTEEVEVDQAGRILVKARFRDKLGLGDEVYVIGRGTKFELWRRDDFDADRAALAGRPDAPAGGPTLIEEVDRGHRAQLALRGREG